MDVLVFGAGSLGSLVGGLLARSHDVTLVGRGDHIRSIRDSGLRVRGAMSVAVTPAVSSDPPGGADLALVTVKAFDTPAAATALADVDIGAAVSLQNGIGNEATLADRLECPVLAATCTYGAHRPEPGHVECTGVGRVTLGPRDGGRSDVAERVGEALASAGVETAVATDMPHRLWEKLAVNCAINAPTALARVENGALVDGPAATVMRAAAGEAAAVARADGVELSDTAATTAARRVAEATADNVSSMLQDVRAGRRTEVDAIAGVVADHDRRTPVNDALAGLVRAWEAGVGLRP